MRWKALIPATLIMALTFGAARLFLDGAVEKAVEKYGTAANGARVDLAGVDIRILNLSVVLRGLQVTDGDDPMTNALDVERMSFKLAPKPLAWKKIVIEDASFDGIRTGTPRKASGALARAEKTAEERKAEEDASALREKTAAAASFAMTNLKEQYDPKKLKPEDLAAYQKIKEEQVHLTALAGTWESKIDAVRPEDTIKRAKDFYERVKDEKYQGLEGIKKAKDDLDEAKKIKKDLEALDAAFRELKDNVKSEIARAKDSLKEIDALKTQDLDKALGDIKGAFSAEGVTKGLIGGAYFGRLKSALAYVEKARKMIPQKKAEEEEKGTPPPARTGKDIPFPFKHNWPAFHLKKASLSGVMPGENPLEYTGSLKDVTSDPKKLGRPITLDIDGRKAPRSLSLKAELDYTQDPSRERVDMTYKGFPLAGIKLGEVGAPVSIREGAGAVTADVTVRGDKLQGQVQFVADPVKLDHALAPGQDENRLMSILHDVFTRLTRLDMTFRLSDTLASPDIKVESSIDGQVKDALKQAVQKELDEVKARFRARLDELVDGEKKKLTDQVNAKIAGVTGKIGMKDQALKGGHEQAQKLLDDLKKKSTQSLLGGSSGEDGDGKPALPDLKNIFKKKK